MTQIEIMGAIMLCTGLRPYKFAELHGLNVQTLYKVIKGDLRTEIVRNIISEETNIPVNDLWQDENTKNTPTSGPDTTVTAGTGTIVPEEGDVLQADG